MLIVGAVVAVLEPETSELARKSGLQLGYGQRVVRRTRIPHTLTLRIAQTVVDEK